jgi:uncharacterized protein
MEPVVAVFARWWASGPVKTRLAATLGAEAARSIYRDVAARVWRGLEAPGLRRHLWVTPGDAVPDAAVWLPRAERVMAQPGGDLGARITRALADALATGAPWAAVVGTDAPAVDAARVLRAGSMLGAHDLAIVPSLDGGYALLALRVPRPELFVDVPWSSPLLLGATLERCAARSLRCWIDAPVRDLDDAADLDAMRRDGLLAADGIEQ